MKFHFLIPFLLVLFGKSSSAQDLKLINTIEGDFNLIMTDNIGKLYLANGDELLLYSAKGKLLYRYSDLSRGEITFLDTRNPLKLLLFYPDYSQISYLDNTLSETREQPIDLSLLGLELVQLACASFDNGLWLYDPISFQLLRFDQGLNVTNEVANINQLIGAEVNPTQMVEADDWLFLNDPGHGVYVFDTFGTYSKLIPIKGAHHIQVRENGLFLLTDKGLIKYDTVTLEKMFIDLPVDDWKELRIGKDRLFVLTKEGVQIYSYTD
ncbi:MAG: hypothetical protein JKX84_05585 [Flavobacteriales bacterium]|nr:hypothetical protein [Flavobacteriales bacterium]